MPGSLINKPKTPAQIQYEQNVANGGRYAKGVLINPTQTAANIAAPGIAATEKANTAAGYANNAVANAASMGASNAAATAAAAKKAADDKAAADEKAANKARIDEQFNYANSGYNRSQEQVNSLWDLTQNKSNPYSMGNPGMLAQRALAKNQINSGYKTQAQQLREHLSQRGMLGTAQEDAAISNMGINSIKDSSQADTQLAADSYGKQQDFEGNRVRSLQDLVGMNTGIANARAGMQAQMFGQGLSTDTFNQAVKVDARNFDYGVKQDVQAQNNWQKTFDFQGAQAAIQNDQQQQQLNLSKKQIEDASSRQDQNGMVQGAIGILKLGGAAALGFATANPALAIAAYSAMNGGEGLGTVVSGLAGIKPTTPTVPKATSLTDFIAPYTGTRAPNYSME